MAKKTNKNQQPAIKILTFTPAWRRLEIFEICLQGIKRLQNYAPDRFEIIPFFVVSESKAAQLVQKYGYNYIVVPNNPLGAKKNIGLRYALDEYEFDYLLEIGSDDLLKNEWLEKCAPLLAAKVPQMNPATCHFLDVLTNTTAHWTTDKILGLGRFISRAAIEKVCAKEELWGNDRERGMDTYSWRQLQKYGIETQLIETDGHIFGIDIKSKVNVNPMNKFTPDNRTPAEILAGYPEREAVLKLINQK